MVRPHLEAAELGCNTTINDEVAGRCDLIFLAVKPQMMEELLAPLRFTLAERPSRFVLCSMAAGLSIARIQEMAGGDYPVIRIMPNTPASVGAGMIQYCTSNVTAEEEAEFLKLMAPAGRLDAVPEGLIDAVKLKRFWLRGLTSEVLQYCQPLHLTRRRWLSSQRDFHHLSSDGQKMGGTYYKYPLKKAHYSLSFFICIL